MESELLDSEYFFFRILVCMYSFAHLCL
jgi:hypothetical protein